jgi:hypothetical protein
VLAARPAIPRRLQEVASLPSEELWDVYDRAEPARVLDLGRGSRVVRRGTGAKGVGEEVGHDHAEVLIGDKRIRVGLDQIEACREEEARQPRVRMSMQVSRGYVLPVNVVA